MSTDKPTLEQVITYLNNRLDGMTMPGAVRMTEAARDYLVELRAELEQMKRCIEIVEHQRDTAIKELEKYMVQDVLEGNEPCCICAKASNIPCEYCDPKWCGQKEDWHEVS